MITLLDIELRRALARRLVRVTTVAAVAAILITFVIVLVRSHGSSGTPSRAFPYSHEQVEACARGELLPPQYEGAPPQILDQLPPDSPRRRALCERAFGQQFTSEEDRRFRLTHLHNVLQGTSGVLFVIAWLFGASLIGAEWRAGTVMTVLTWEPRRLRLILVKAAAAVILAVAFTLAMQAVLSLLLWVVASTRGITEGADAAWFRGVVGVLLRGLLLSAVFAGVGFSVGSLGRNTAAALGAGFGYLIVLEQILAGVVEWIRPWLIIGNTAVLLSGHSLGEIAGRTPFEAGLILSLYGAGLVAIATAVFRRRDVAA